MSRNSRVYNASLMAPAVPYDMSCDMRVTGEERDTDNMSAYANPSVCHLSTTLYTFSYV